MATKVVICWGDVAGYTGACWRALAARSGIDLFVIASKGGSDNPNAPFDDSVVRDVPCRLLTMAERENGELVESLVAEQNPDVIVLCGWFIPTYARLPKAARLAGKKFILAMDTPLRHTWRQWAGRLKIARLFRRIDRIMVGGERSWYLATYLGAREPILRRGMNGIDFDSWTEAHQRRLATNPSGWPARFVFVGRYIDIKGIDVLVDAYRMYRASRTGQDAWPLTCCGRGPRAGLLTGIEGLTDRGFVQPRELAGVFAEHGVLVLPSRYDPWPLTVVEGAAAGLPVICSEACGSAVEVVRSFFNGLTVTTGDAAALAGAMKWMHEHQALLPEFGRRGSVLASAYSAERWADRWESCIRELHP